MGKGRQSPYHRRYGLISWNLGDDTIFLARCFPSYFFVGWGENTKVHTGVFFCPCVNARLMRKN